MECWMCLLHRCIPAPVDTRITPIAMAFPLPQNIHIVDAKVYSVRGSRSESDTESASRGAFSRLTLTFTSLPSYFLLLPYDVVVTGEDHLNRRVMLLLPSSCELARAAAAHR